MENKFDWAESVRVKNTVPTSFRPGEIVSICGMTKVDSKVLADVYKANLGEWVYTIEYTGGDDAQIRECHLEKYEGANGFHYGESVRISKDALEKYHPGELGFICGMIDIDSEEVAAVYDCVGSRWLYTVELIDGSSLLIPEKLLEKDTS
ncbi:MAG: hypothetical protein HYX48_01725 [Chlamydiales bacterium]|nr:hypothetical protein [Chlamydiales bacterium]